MTRAGASRLLPPDQHPFVEGKLCRAMVAADFVENPLGHRAIFIARDRKPSEPEPLIDTLPPDRKRRRSLLDRKPRPREHREMPLTVEFARRFVARAPEHRTREPLPAFRADQR